MFGQPLARYVAAVVVGGCLCLAALIATGGLDLLDARQPELLLLLMACAVVAELTPLKVVLRAAEGEITASNTFAFALLICYGAAPPPWRSRWAPSSPTASAASRSSASPSTRLST